MARKLGSAIRGTRAELCTTVVFLHLGMRADRGTGATTEEAQVWQAVRAQLRSLDSASSLAAYEKLLKAHADAKNIDALYDATEHAVHEEQK